MTPRSKHIQPHFLGIIYCKPMVDSTLKNKEQPEPELNFLALCLAPRFSTYGSRAYMRVT